MKDSLERRTVLIYYQNEADARYHFNLFHNGRTGLHRSILLKRNTQLIDAILF